jgi:hypothetical protein
MGNEEILIRFADQARASMADFLAVDDAGELQIDWARAEHAGQFPRIKKLTVHERFFAGKEPRAERLADRRITFELVDTQAALGKLAEMAGLLKGDNSEADAAARALMMLLGGGPPVADTNVDGAGCPLQPASDAGV